MNETGKIMGIAKKEAILTPKGGDGAVDKIRDLLFGTQMENYDQHFQHLETMIVAETKKSTDEMGRRLQAVEALINQRLEKSEQALERERKERVSAFNSVNEALQQSFQQLNDRLDTFESTTDRNIADIKDTLEHESRSLAAQIKALRDELTQTLHDEANRLDRQKVNRQQLADLLLGLSNELNRS
jgi:small-conductance mechanosensitive channel